MGLLSFDTRLQIILNRPCVPSVCQHPQQQSASGLSQILDTEVGVNVLVCAESSVSDCIAVVPTSDLSRHKAGGDPYQEPHTHTARLSSFHHELPSSSHAQGSQGKYGNLDASVVSYGPCQTPTLNFCVERHQRIMAFQPEPYWTLKPLCTKNGRE